MHGLCVVARSHCPCLLFCFNTQDYTESFYTLMLPDEAAATTEPSQQHQGGCRSHAELLEEMVCQRLAQDFQIVETPGHRKDAARANAGLLKCVKGGDSL